MRKIGTINANDIIEQDDGSVTFSAGATNDNGTRKKKTTRIKQALQPTPALSWTF
jgi:hypothetical protein